MDARRGIRMECDAFHCSISGSLDRSLPLKDLIPWLRSFAACKIMNRSFGFSD